MANALFLSPYYSDLATLSYATGGNDASFPVTNLQLQNPNKKWRTTQITGSQYLGIDFGSAIACTALALVGANLNAGDTWKIGASATNAATAASAPSFTAIAAGTSVWISPKPTEPLQTNLAAFASWAAGGAYRYWAVSFTSASPLTYLEFGRLFAGVAFQPTSNYEPNVQHTRISADAVEITEYGQVMSERRGYTRRQWNVGFQYLDQDECFDQADELARIRGAGGDIFASLDPTNTSRFAKWSMQCLMTPPIATGTPFFKNNKDCFQFTTQLGEVL